MVMSHIRTVLSSEPEARRGGVGDCVCVCVSRQRTEDLWPLKRVVVMWSVSRWGEDGGGGGGGGRFWSCAVVAIGAVYVYMCV